VIWLRVRSVRDRRLLARHRRVARLELASKRSRARRSRAGSSRETRHGRPRAHSDRGLQYLSIRHTERFAEAGIERSVGSVGDSYDDALAESVIGLLKTEVIRQRGPWRNIDAVECAVLEWVDWFNNRRLLEPLDYVPPAEYEVAFYSRQNTPAAVAGLM